MAGLLGNLTNSLDNTLTAGDEAKGQGRLLGSVTGAIGKTVDGAGNAVGQTTDGVGNVVGHYASPLLSSKSLTVLTGKSCRTTSGDADTAGVLTDTAADLVGGATGQQLQGRTQ